MAKQLGPRPLLGLHQFELTRCANAVPHRPWLLGISVGMCTVVAMVLDAAMQSTIRRQQRRRRRWWYSNTNLDTNANSGTHKSHTGTHNSGPLNSSPHNTNQPWTRTRTRRLLLRPWKRPTFVHRRRNEPTLEKQLGQHSLLGV
jgi:hypothetical protein